MFSSRKKKTDLSILIEQILIDFRLLGPVLVDICRLLYSQFVSTILNVDDAKIGYAHGRTGRGVRGVNLTPLVLD